MKSSSPPPDRNPEVIVVDARHVLAVGAALLIGAISSIFVAAPLFNVEHAWYIPIHRYLNSIFPEEWRWLGKNAILIALVGSVCVLPALLAYVLFPNRLTKSDMDKIREIQRGVSGSSSRVDVDDVASHEAGCDGRGT